MAVITLLNQKGGVGKTSTCHHLAGTLAQMGRRVLLLDNDPAEFPLSRTCGGRLQPARSDPSETLASVYSGDVFPEQVIRPSGIAGIDLVAGSRAVNDWNLPRPYEARIEAQMCLREVRPSRFEPGK